MVDYRKDCIGCGGTISTAYRMCERCCRLLGVEAADEQVAKEARPYTMLSQEPDPAATEREFLLSFTTLGIAALVIMSRLGVFMLSGPTAGCLC